MSHLKLEVDLSNILKLSFKLSEPVSVYIDLHKFIKL